MEPRRRAARRRTDRLHGQARDAADLVVVLADHAAGVGRQVRHPDERLGGANVLGCAEHLRLAPVVHLGRGEHRARLARHRVEEREVLGLLGRLGELDVVDDRLRARPAQLVDDLRVAAALERPDLGVGRSNVLGSTATIAMSLRAAGLQARAGVERLVLERVADARQQHDEPDRRAEDRRERERAKAWAAPHRPVPVAGQVAVAAADRDGALADGVADAHRAVWTRDQRAVAAVGRAPDGAAHGRRRVAAPSCGTVPRRSLPQRVCAASSSPRTARACRRSAGRAARASSCRRGCASATGGP